MSKAELAIKFGSNEIVIYRKGLGIVARQSSYLAMLRNKPNGKIYAYGSEAEKLCNIKNMQYMLVQPIKGIEITNRRLAVELMKNVLSKATFDSYTSISALVAVPCAMTEKKLLELKIVLQQAGISKVNFVQNAVCVRAQEFNLDASDKCLVVDMGKYIVDISVVSRYAFEYGRDYFIGGAEMDMAISTYVADNYDVDITNEQAEAIKNEIASMYENDMYTASFEGITKSGTYKDITIRANEIRVAIIGVYDKIFDLISEVLESLPIDTLAEIRKNGIIFTGGVSSICGLSEYAFKKLGIPVISSDNPKDAVILGAGKLLSLSLEDYPHINI